MQIFIISPFLANLQVQDSYLLSHDMKNIKNFYGNITEAAFSIKFEHAYRTVVHQTHVYCNLSNIFFTCVSCNFLEGG